MNWLKLSETDVLKIVDPIMNNIMESSTNIDHEKHVRDFSENMKAIVTKEELENQCVDYQKRLGVFTKRELIGIIRKKNDVRVFWRQWYSKSDDEFLAFIHLMKRGEKFEVVNCSVT